MQRIVDEKERAERLRAEYLDVGFQYYMLGRCGVASCANPVAGNQFHHAIEMLLKGALVPHTTEDERIEMRHRLPRIWKKFKEQHDSSNRLALFDALVRSLQKYEKIRYPEKIVQAGMASSFQFGSGPPPKATGKASVSVPIFHLAVGEVDALVKAICVACSINPKFFTARFGPPGSTCLRRDNAEDLF